MKANFKNSLKHVLVHEGGWADHPRDPGGATMKGVTLLVYRNHFGAKKTKNDLRNITDSELEQIYRTGYWEKCKCDDLPSGVDYAVFDSAVNSGPGRGAKWLQAAVGATQDGGIRPKTLEKLKGFEPAQIVNSMCDNRLSFLRSLATWQTFGRGWQKRVEDLRRTAVGMAGGSVPDVTVSTDYETVKKGSSGPWVKKLQEALRIQVDGEFGSGTEKALKAWQTRQGLTPDGIAGRNTYRALGLIL
ncbi:MAG: glycosyl hydrolase 108 family protein [Bacteroidales bacterium]